MGHQSAIMNTRRRSAMKTQNIFAEDSLLQASSTNNSSQKLYDLKSSNRIRTPEFSFQRVDLSNIKMKQPEHVSTQECEQVTNSKRVVCDSDIKMTTKDSWIKLLEDCGHGLVSDLRGNSSIRRTTMAIGERNNRQITSFDDFSNIKVEYEEEKDAQVLLGKRSRGRPTKEVSKALAQEAKKREEKIKKTTFEGYICKGADPLGFESDGEGIEMNLEYEDLRGPLPEIAFGPRKFRITECPQTRGTLPFTLDLQKLFKMINFYDDQQRSRQFLCKFCGKSFDKPSSLGGHTAKAHYGLSLKYRNRLNAAMSRQAERKRLQYLKSELPKLYGMAGEKEIPK